MQGKVDFNRQIRPILSDKCYKCHGPDAKNQKSDFRIDSFEEAIKEHNGFVGLTPGNLEESEIHWRIYSDDPIDVMPPPESKHPLTAAEKKLIDQWIKRRDIKRRPVPSPTVKSEPDPASTSIFVFFPEPDLVGARGGLLIAAS